MRTATSVFPSNCGQGQNNASTFISAVVLSTKRPSPRDDNFFCSSQSAQLSFGHRHRFAPESFCSSSCVSNISANNKSDQQMKSGLVEDLLCLWYRFVTLQGLEAAVILATPSQRFALYFKRRMSKDGKMRWPPAQPAQRPPNAKSSQCHAASPSNVTKLNLFFDAGMVRIKRASRNREATPVPIRAAALLE